MFKDSKIFILGMARSGYEAARVLIKRGNEVILNDFSVDQDENHVKELENMGVKVILGNHPLDLITSDISYIIKNPGIKDDNVMIVKGKELGIPIINEVEMAYRLLPKDISIIGVTGSNGKTTTTTLIYEMLKSSGAPVVLAGNIGFPLSSFIDTVKSGDILLMEVSVQQLCNLEEFKTNVSVLMNIYDNVHLEIVGSKENYIKTKRKIFNHHSEGDYAVVNFDNEDAIICASDIMSQIEYFSMNNNASACYIKDSSIYYKDEFIIKLEDIKLKGDHNYQNIMASIMVSKHFNVSNEIIIEVLKTFNGVEHRIEYVKSINGIDIYNDSKSTNIKATQTSLKAFNKPVVLLLGGMDRGQVFSDLNDYISNVKNVICYGETKNKIKEYCDNMNISCDVVSNLEEAVDVSYKKCVSGDVLLLSPASASWDQFKDFEERGRLFKEYINRL